MFAELLTAPLLPWQDGSGEAADIVLESRIRLVRNLKKYVFPGKASAAELQAVLTEAKAQVPRLQQLGTGRYEYLDLGKLSPAERDLAAAKHFIAPSQPGTGQGLLLREDGAAEVIVNEGEHFIIQAAAAGAALDTVWRTALQLDDTLESKLNFAFRDDFGYLTANPALTGTGLVAGVTLHLPGLVTQKRMQKIVQGITKFGFSVCGVYCRGNTYIGNIFQIANQITLGMSEDDVLTQLKKIVTQIVKEERNCRQQLLERDENGLRDGVLRSYGILSQAWLMEQEEAIRLLSDLRLGIDLGIIHERPSVYEALLFLCETAHLRQSGAGKNDDAEDRVRADIIRESLAAYAI